MSGSDRGGGGEWRPVAKPPVSAPVDQAGAGDGRGIGVAPDPCSIMERTNLNSVVRQVLATVRVGDFLDVVYLPGPPSRLVAQTTAGAIVGSITSPSLLQFIQCIMAGRSYVAAVTSVQGAICQVTVQPK